MADDALPPSPLCFTFCARFVHCSRCGNEWDERETAQLKYRRLDQNTQRVIADRLDDNGVSH